MLAACTTVDPFLRLGGEKGGKSPAARPGCTSAPSLAKAAATSGERQAFVDRGVEPLDDRPRACRPAPPRRHRSTPRSRARRSRIMVGTLRDAAALRVRSRPPARAASPSRSSGKHAADVAEEHLHLPAQHAGHRLGGALVGDVDDIDAGAQLEQFGREVGGIAVPGRAVIELAGIGLGVGDELAAPTSPRMPDGRPAPRGSAKPWRPERTPWLGS